MRFSPLLKKTASLIAIMLLLLSGCGVNNIPSYDEAAKASFSQVSNQYKRRSDLIPNLVNVVKGYAAHEKETLEAVVKARRQVASTPVPPDLINNPAALQQFEKNQQIF